MNQKHLRLASLLILISSSAIGQTSVVQSGSGETSFANIDDEVVTLNFTKNEIGFNVNQYNSNTTWDMNYGLEGSFAASDGTSQLFDGGEFTPNASFGFIVAMSKVCDRKPGAFKCEPNLTAVKNKISTKRIIYFTAKPSWENFNLLDRTANFDNIISEEHDFGIQFSLGYNRHGSIGGNYSAWGISASGGSGNNHTDLTDYKVAVQQLITNTDGSQVVSTTTDEKLAYGPLSNYDDNNGYLNINFDYLIFPSVWDSTVALGLSSRNEFKKGVKPTYSFLLGGYATNSRDGNPSKILGGLQIEFDDFLNIQDEESNMFKRSSINLVVGYNF